LAKAVSFLSERELAIYTLTFQQRLDNLGRHIITRFRDHENTGVLPALAYNNALFHKGFLLNAAASLKNLSTLSPASVETNTRLKSYRRLLAAEFAKPVAQRDSTNVAELEENANTLEKELAHTVAGYSEAIRQVKWPEVKTALKRDEAAVEFVHYRYSAPNATDSTLYAALVLRPGDAQPLFVSLFDEKELMPLLSGATGGNNFLKINALYAAQKVV
ncbi:MAG: hypothetical protein L6Q97_27715, partial [Thermoanaerobaculia bacterium]|nr:hypothetical protein [Thermoanaerobaculia bacterium]